MYICRHCGQVSQNDNINYCTNIKCKYYGYSYGANNSTKGSLSNAMSGFNEPTYDKRNPMYENKAMMYDGKKVIFDNNPMTNNSMMGNSMNKPMMNDAMRNEERATSESVMSKNSCGMIAFATVPMQGYEKMMPLNESLKAGTIYSSLNMPYDKKILWRG